MPSSLPLRTQNVPPQQPKAAEGEPLDLLPSRTGDGLGLRLARRGRPSVPLRQQVRA